MEFYLPAIMAVIIAVGVALYVILDGFDLGIGILFPFAPTEKDRTVMMNSIAPVWDGNETWLVLGGGGLLAAFPAAYGVLMPALYIPIIVMLLALIFRGIAFEFRARASAKSKKVWNTSFAVGSTLATFSQGVVLGAFIQGVAVTGDGMHNYAFAGGVLDWFSPFSMMCGVALVCGYALLGATWLISKTEGSLQKWSRMMARMSLVGVAFFIAVVSAWTPMQDPEIMDRWFDGMNFAMLFPVPIVTLYFVARLWTATKSKSEHGPFLYTVALFLLSFFGLGISYWPYLVPRKITLWQAAANTDSLLLILIGVGVILPLILFYTAYIYRVFWGKTGEHGYH